MSTSTNFLLRSIFSAIFSLAILGAISASTNSFSTIDSCSANIDVQYDSSGSYATLNVSHSGSPNSSVHWSDSSTSHQITVTASGEYCVTVYTETQCEVTQCVNVDIGAGANCQSYIIKESLPEGGYMLIAETNDPHANTAFVWSNGESNNSITVYHSGEFCVDVTSSYGCPSKACIYIDVPIQNDSCAVTVFSYPDTIYGGAYVSVDPSGIGPFTYIWSNGSITNSIDVETSGEYCVTVTDAEGCEGVGCKIVEVSQPNHIIEFTVPHDIELSLDQECFADVLPAVTGDVNDEYTSCGSGYEATYTDQVMNTCGGSYIISRTWSLADDCGNVEVKTQTITVADNIAPTFTVPADITLYMDPANCWSDTSTVHTGFPSDVIDNCSHQIYTHYDSQTTSVADNSNCGYHYRITRVWFSVDECGNQTTKDQIITIIDTTQNNGIDSCSFNVVIFEKARTTDVVALDVDPAGVAPFTYLWSDGSTGQVLDTQVDGHYCLTVTDGNGCEGYTCHYVEMEPVAQDTCSTWLELLPQENGTVKVWAHSEGSGAMTYIWSNDTPGTVGEPYFYASESGEYCVTVYDANQCESHACIYVEIPPIEPTDSCYSWIVKTHLGANDNRYKLSVETVGQGPYTIAWHDSTYQDGDYLYAEQSGNYCVTVYDANQCFSEACIQVEVHTAPVDSCKFDITIFEKERNIDVVKLGADPAGVAPFTYHWTDGSTSDFLYVQAEGEYCVTIIDANGCEGNACYYVELEPVGQDTCSTWLELLPQDNGTVKVWAHSAGSGAMTYIWSNTAAGTAGEPYFYASESGDYCVTVYDANQCESRACIYVETHPVPVDSCKFDITIFEKERNIDVVKLGADPAGVAPFTYHWTDGSTSDFLYVQAEGEYCVTIKDADGCVGNACYFVEFDPVGQDTCSTWLELLPQDNGTVKIWAHSKGSGSLTYLWSNDAAGTAGEPYFYASVSGEYCVSVYDANQCESKACIYVEIPTTEPNDSCRLELVSTLYADDFVAEIKAESYGVAPFEYKWSDGTSGNAIELHESQEVCVTVTDAAGCVSSKCIRVEVPKRPCSVQIIRSNSSTDSQVVLEAIVEGEGDIRYLWSDGTSDDHISVKESGEYCLTIVASNGCSKTACVFIDIANIICKTEIIYNPNSTDYEAILDAAPAGVEPFIFEWSNGSTSSTTKVVESGTYCVVVTDARGCVSEMCEDVILAIPVCESKIVTIAESDDHVTIGVKTEGMAPFQYYWSNGENGQEITVSESKEYCVEVIDALGCMSFDCMYIKVVDFSTCSVEIQVVANADSTEFKVIAHPSGTAPFTYKWAHGDTSRYFYPELDGYFCVTVIDAEGCESKTCFKTEGITPTVELEAFPNPAQDHFFIEIDSELEFHARVEIRDIEGNLLFTTTVDIEEGIQGLNFNSAQYPSGVFFVNIIRGSHVETIKVIKAGN